MRRAILPLICALIVPLSVGCNGSSDSSSDLSYAGVWDVQYNFIKDECALALEGIPGFVDQHTIEQSDLVITLSARSGLLDVANGQIRDDHSLLVSQSIEGDVFGIGVACTVLTTVSYEALHDDTTDTLFSQRISCADGYECETAAVGSASRQATNA